MNIEEKEYYLLAEDLWEESIYLLPLGKAPSTIYHILSISNKSLKYPQETKNTLIYTLILFPNFTLAFPPLKLCNNHSTHVQQMIMKPQVFISIQNGFFFFFSSP